MDNFPKQAVSPLPKYLKSILTKLCMADRTEAVTVAIQRGLIHL
jgi:DNA-binding NarL/FixJ family response regulator